MNNPQSGKVAIYTIALGIALFFCASQLDPFDFSAYRASDVRAGTATTSVTVLNTAPLWAVDAEEFPGSSTSSPTNAGSNVVWVGTATDGNADPFYLLLCKTSSTPTGNSGAPPTCGGGAGNMWAVSALTNSNVQATTTYTTTSTDPEENIWFAWICDGNAISAKCNATYKQGSGSTASPFAVNHRPGFTAVMNTSPKDPGTVVAWNTSSSDADSYDSADQVRLWVCKANDFATSSCGVGGTYCSSTLANSNPSCSYTLDYPLPDGPYASYPIIVDTHNFQSGSAVNATNSVVTVSNVRPSVASSSISLNDTDGSGPLILANPAGQTNNFTVRFTVSDSNSCLTQGSTDEIVSSTVDVYRSGVGQAGCSTSGHYDPTDCYTSSVGVGTWGFFCSQDGGTCSNNTDPLVDWTCNFPLWYLADPTDGANATDTQFYAQYWLASVVAIDDDGATSTKTEAATPGNENEMASYMAHTLNSNAIAYGSLSPGDFTPNLVATTTLTAQGNVGVDQTIYGSDMCVNYPSCASGSVTSTIAIQNHQFATSSVAYNGTGAFIATSSPGSLLDINIQKPTSTPTSKITYWGIQIPGTLQLAGDYTGQNTIIGVKGEAQNW